MTSKKMSENGQKFTKNAPKWSICRVFENMKFSVKSVTKQDNFKWQKIAGKSQIGNIECDILGYFQAYKSDKS